MHGLYFLAEQQIAADGYAENDIMGRFLEKGLSTAILGMVTVFAVLSLLWGCLEIFKYVFYTLPERKKNAQNASPEAQVSESAASEPEPTVYETEDDGELVAAIMAAVSAYRAEEGAPAMGFRVVSFRKRSGK